MKKIYQPGIRLALIFTFLIFISGRGTSQTTMPDVLNKSTLKEQLNFVQERTRIYEEYRAIREDMFQKIKGNALDSLSGAKKEIRSLKNLTSGLKLTIDSMKASSETTRKRLEEITRTKNSIKVLGIEANKATYNSIMWTIVAGLLIVLTVGFLAFKRNLDITVRTKKDLEDLKTEFEAYRKTSREAREKMSMAHFNEIQKMKGG